MPDELDLTMADGTEAHLGLRVFLWSRPEHFKAAMAGQQDVLRPHETFGYYGQVIGFAPNRVLSIRVALDDGTERGMTPDLMTRA